MTAPLSGNTSISAVRPHPLATPNPHAHCLSETMPHPTGSLLERRQDLRRGGRLVTTSNGREAFAHAVDAFLRRLPGPQ
jgi:hypothetical protein